MENNLSFSLTKNPSNVFLQPPTNIMNFHFSNLQLAPPPFLHSCWLNMPVWSYINKFPCIYMAPTVWGLTETNITYQTKTAADKTYNNPTSSFPINLPSSQWLSGTRTMCRVGKPRNTNIWNLWRDREVTDRQFPATIRQIVCHNNIDELSINLHSKIMIQSFQQHSSNLETYNVQYKLVDNLVR